MKMIAVCEFEKSEKQYEYLCELPDDANLDELKYAVTARIPTEAPRYAGWKTKNMLPQLNVVYIRQFKYLADQYHPAELERLVLVFGMSEFIEHAIRKQKVRTLKANLERKLAEMSIFDKIRSLGIQDETITQMAEELKKLMKE